MSASTFEEQAAIPFFFRDAKRNFYVEPKDKWIPLFFIDIVKKPEIVPFLPYVATLQKVQIAPESSVAQAIIPSSISRLQTVQLAEQPGANIGVASKTATSNALFSTVATAASAFGGKSLFRVPDQQSSGFLTKALSFHNFYHPHTETFIDQLNRFGVAGLLNQDTVLTSDDGAAFKIEYQPSALLVSTPYPPVKVEFDENGAYSIYNWELFFHAPLYIATRLTKNGKYAEAMQWYHAIFNPMTAEKPDLNNKHYWQVPPFKLDTIETIDAFFDRLANGKATGDDSKHLNEWRKQPFKPHLIARGRPVAYMKNVVMKYIENLVAWGDDLFRRDTIESINEATQLYIIAAHILGKRPESIPARGKVAPETYASLRGKLDKFGNALVALENLFPNASAIPVSSAAAIAANGSLLGVGTALLMVISFLMRILSHQGCRLYWIKSLDAYRVITIRQVPSCLVKLWVVAKLTT